LAIHIVLSSIGVVSFPKSGALRIHFWSMVLSVILLVAGFFFYEKLLRAQAIFGRQRTLMEKSRKRWCHFPHVIYEERWGRESNPQIDSAFGIYPNGLCNNTNQNIIDVDECSDYVLTHAKPHARFASTVSLLDLLLHERNRSTPKKINENQNQAA